MAIDGDTKFETSTAKHTADTHQTGAWSRVSKQVTLGNVLAVGKKNVELHATAMWSYTGGSTGTPPTTVGPFLDSATLTAKPTRLTDGGRHLLVHDDRAEGTIDAANRIVVVASQSKLRTD